MADELRQAAWKALEHVVELRDAWMRGAIDERDGNGGTRSNRNVDVETALREALTSPLPADLEAELRAAIARAFERRDERDNYTRIDLLLAEEIRPLLQRAAGVRADDPELDATDAAHPAWWRGHDHTTQVFCQKVNDILDGKDDGAGVANEPWESTRRRLLALRVPADDGEPVTEGWLNTVMPFDDEIDRHFAYATATWVPLTCDDACDRWWFGDIPIPRPETRGDVRRLCAALGVPLKEAT